MCQFLQNPEDLQWLRDVHLPAAAPAFRSAIIYGNEDFPTKIELYADRMPHYQAKPVATITQPEAPLDMIYIRPDGSLTLLRSEAATSG